MIAELSGSPCRSRWRAIRSLPGRWRSVNEMSQSISAATEEQTTNAQAGIQGGGERQRADAGAASSAEEMSAATEQLSHMAQELQRLVAQFKTETNGLEELPLAVVQPRLRDVP